MASPQTNPSLTVLPMRREKRRSNRPMILGILHLCNALALYGIGMVAVTELQHDTMKTRLVTWLVTLSFLCCLFGGCIGALSISISSCKTYNRSYKIAHNALAVLLFLLSSLSLVTFSFGYLYFSRCKRQSKNKELAQRVYACALVSSLFGCALAMLSITSGIRCRKQQDYLANETSGPSCHDSTCDVQVNPTSTEDVAANHLSRFAYLTLDISTLYPHVADPTRFEATHQFQMVTNPSGQQFFMLPVENMQEFTGNIEQETSMVILPPYHFNEAPPPYCK